jgi:hypothetical protein
MIFIVNECFYCVRKMLYCLLAKPLTINNNKKQQCYQLLYAMYVYIYVCVRVCVCVKRHLLFCGMNLYYTRALKQKQMKIFALLITVKQVNVLQDIAQARTL